jgi:hypothetical protein
VVERPNKFQAALMAGIIFGVLSSIPFVNFINICCCLWFVIGGAMAARSLINRSTVFPVTSGEGAAVGALAGAICAAVDLVLGMPLALLTNELVFGALQGFITSVQDPRLREQFEEVMRASRDQPIAQQILGHLFQWLILAAVGTGFATLGGVIGVAMFEKRKGQPMPPPPPGPGGYQGYPPQG